MSSHARDAWDVQVPDGWEPVAALCVELFHERDHITELINDRIREEISEFRGPRSVITRRDLSWSTGGGVANFLRGVAELTPPTERDVEFQRLVGRRSVTLGLPLEPLIASYQVGFRELWALLARHAAERPDAARLLLKRGTIVWERLLATTTAVTEGYQQEQARREAFEATTTAHLLEALENDATAEAGELARDLGFDPEGSFQVIEMSGPVTIEERVRTVLARLIGDGCRASMSRRGRGAVIVVQCAAEDTLAEAVAGVPADTSVGVGTAAPGVSGVLASMREARLALSAAAVLGRTIRFKHDWLRSIVVSQADVLRRLLARGIDLTRAKPHLADAVQAFADAGFSVAESAARLKISPSSQRYRLARWRAQTGWDPLSLDGLVRSLIAVEVGRAGR